MGDRLSPFVANGFTFSEAGAGLVRKVGGTTPTPDLLRPRFANGSISASDWLVALSSSCARLSVRASPLDDRRALVGDLAISCGLCFAMLAFVGDANDGLEVLEGVVRVFRVGLLGSCAVGDNLRRLAGLDAMKHSSDLYHCFLKLRIVCLYF